MGLGPEYTPLMFGVELAQETNPGFCSHFFQHMDLDFKKLHIAYLGG